MHPTYGRLNLKKEKYINETHIFYMYELGKFRTVKLEYTPNIPIDYMYNIRG